MAPPPEYDKEPKAPDKSVTSDNCDNSKTNCNSSSEQFTISDSKSHNNVTNTDVESNSHVGTLDDGQLRALLDEAITYKCPKDREGKSSLFKELLEEVEQDEQACEAAARELTGSRGKRAGKGRRQLPHSNSLQDLVAALAAESAPRRARAVPVSTRAIHGGSLPSGVDTSFLLSEEPSRGGYLATVRCVNPPPLSERAAEAPAAPAAHGAPAATDNHRRSKPTTGVTYTARATLEIGGGRAVTTTTASNQVRTPPPRHAAPATPPRPRVRARAHGGGTARQPRGPLTNHTDKSERNKLLEVIEKPLQNTNVLLEVFERNLAATQDNSSTEEDTNIEGKSAETTEQAKSKVETRIWRNSARKIQKQKKTRHSPGEISKGRKNTGLDKKCLQSIQFGDISNTEVTTNFNKDNQEHATGSTTSRAVRKNADTKLKCNDHSTQSPKKSMLLAPDTQNDDSRCQGKEKQKVSPTTEAWHTNINTWYEELQTNSIIHSAFLPKTSPLKSVNIEETSQSPKKSCDETNTGPSINLGNTATGTSVCSASKELGFPLKRPDFALRKDKQKRQNEEDETLKIYLKVNDLISGEKTDDRKQNLAEQIKYRKHVGKNLKVPSLSDINPKNVKSMTIGKLPAEASQTKPSTSNMFYDNLKYLYEKSKSEDIDKAAIIKPKDKNPQKPFEGVSSIIEKSKDLSRKLSNKGDNYDKTVDRVTNLNKPEFINVKTKNENTCLLLKDNSLKIIKNDPVLRDVELNDKETQSVATTIVQEKKDFEVKGNAETNTDEIELIDMGHKSEQPSITSHKDTEIELKDIPTLSETVRKEHSFTEYYANQERLFNILESNNNLTSNIPLNNLNKNIGEKVHDQLSTAGEDDKHGATNQDNIQVKTTAPKAETELVVEKETKEDSKSNINETKILENSQAKGKTTDIARASTSETTKPAGEPYILAELPNNACYYLTLPQSLLTDKKDDPQLSNNNIKPYNSGEGSKGKKAKPADPETQTVIEKNLLRNLLYVTLFHSMTDNAKAGLPRISEVEVDSAIPFNCITTPEVVASCNTTSTTQSAATVDPKPLQLGSCYRAVASLTGPPAPPAPPPHPAHSHSASDESATSPGVNGLPMSRASDDEYKKSLDENGNSLAGSSPPSGLAGKKQRRKRSTRNETVTKSHHIDGYQGNKDLKELLRFIEASAAPRPRRKPPPDSEDKKKRRKPSTGVLARAASLESVAAPPAPPLPPAPSPEPPATGFTTVSRRRRARRKPDHEPPSSPPPATVAASQAGAVAVVPDLIESHRVRKAPPPRSPPRKPDVVRRPAVQLPKAPPPPPGLRFGFDVNETLLPPTSPPAAHAPPPAAPAPPPAARAPPAPPSPQLMQIVDYIGHAWEDVIKCLGGKVRYYSE